MAFKPILPRGAGSNRRGFDALINKLANFYPKAIEEAYVYEMELIIKDVIAHTPIDTGAAAGVTNNAVGQQKRNFYSGHAAYPGTIGNNPGNTGWQLEVEQKKNLKIAIVNPQWDSYLKFLEMGVVEPIAPAKSHFVYNAWQKHLKRRDQIHKRIQDASNRF